MPEPRQLLHQAFLVRIVAMIGALLAFFGFPVTEVGSGVFVRIGCHWIRNASQVSKPNPCPKAIAVPGNDATGWRENCRWCSGDLTIATCSVLAKLEARQLHRPPLHRLRQDFPKAKHGIGAYRSVGSN